jgi:glycosyltransferase involved in cell wall biosynthesis
MRRPRLLRIANVADNRTGGMSRTMHLTSDHLREAGFEVRHLFADAFRWPRPGGWARFFDPLQAGCLVRRAAREWGSCDLVEAHEPLAGGCGLFRSLSHAPWKLVAFSYGLENRGFEAHLNQLGRSGSPLRRRSRMTGHTQGWMSAAGLNWCDHVVCSNQSDIDYLLQKGFTSSQLTRHFSGIDDKSLKLGRHGCAKESKRLLFVGSWIGRKGTREIVPAVTQLLQENLDASFTIAGCAASPSEVLPLFANALHNRIQVIPHIADSSQMAALYQSHSLFLLPSHFEGQPLVMMEAAAFGLAIITTPICGMLDFIRHESNGLFVEVGNAAALHAAADRLLKNPELASRLGEQARLDVESHTWAASAANLARAYRRLLPGETPSIS